MIVIPTKDELTPKPFSAGVYKGVVSNTKLEKTKTGKDMIVLEITVNSQGPNTNEKTIGRKLFENVVISPETMWRVDIVLKACTGQGLLAHFSEGDNVGIDPFYMKVSGLCQGREVVIVVGVEKITDGDKAGEDRNVIKELRAVG